MKFKKRHIQWTGDNIQEIKCFMYPIEPMYLAHYKNSNEIIGIMTNEGMMVANINDWIIKEPFETENIKFYPCKPDIFEKTYEIVLD